MSDLTTLLEREERHYELPPGAFDRLEDRRDRRRRTRRITALAFTLILLAVAIGGAIVLLRSSEQSVPAEEPKPGALEAVAVGPANFGGLTIDEEGALWWKGFGLSRFDPTTGAFRTFTAADDPAFQDYWEAAPARDGGMWITLPDEDSLESGDWRFEIRRFDGETFRESLGVGSVRTVAEGPDGTVWGSGEDGVFRWDGASWISVPSDGRPVGWDGGVDGRIAVAPNGDVWATNERWVDDGSGGVTLRPHGISRYDGTTWTTWTTSDGVPSDEIFAIEPGPGGDVWIGTDAGAAVFRDGSWTAYPRAETGIGRVGTIAATEDGVWIAGDGGISRFDGSTWIANAEDGLEAGDFGWVLAGPSGMWATADAGLFGYDGSRWQLRLASYEGPADVGRVAAVGADDVWAVDAWAKGIWRLDGETWSLIDEGAGTWSGVNDIAVAPDGTPWVATDQGLASFDGSGWRIAEPGEHWRIAFGPGGEVWSVSGAPEDFTLRQIGGTSGSPPIHLPSVSSLAVDPSGNLWAGSAGARLNLYEVAPGGLLRFDGEAWREMEPVGGESEFFVRDIEATADGDVWVSVVVPAEDGVSVSVVARYREGTWTEFRDARGMPFDLEGSGLLDASPNGDVLLTTADRLMRFRDGEWTTLAEGAFSELSIAPDGTVWLDGPDALFRIPAS